MSSALTAVLNFDRQAPLMPLSLNVNCPFTAPFQSPIQVSSTSIEQNVTIWLSLSLEMIVISNSKNTAWFPEKTFFSIPSKLPSWNYFKALISWKTILSDQLQRTLLKISKFYMKSSKLVCRASIFVQTVSFMHKLRMEVRQPTVCPCPLLWIRLEKWKEIKLKILVYFHLECVVLSPS